MELHRKMRRFDQNRFLFSLDVGDVPVGMRTLSPEAIEVMERPAARGKNRETSPPRGGSR